MGVRDLRFIHLEGLARPEFAEASLAVGERLLDRTWRLRPAGAELTDAAGAPPRGDQGRRALSSP